ncbi:MAG: hypothetical protein ABW360_09760 [Phenylobacterium sp.]
MSLSRWVLVLLGVMIAAAVVGFLVDAVRVIAGLLFVGCLVVLGFKALTAKGSRS